eukprot:CAMPEP_0183516746 /NCGR_PEP_ID=MMETSP0371-20130417/14422_1 /TAXON_ID=268820 /ORGANISM="Peridinium aciculiferum, Strain PAER-2" /LENGTH=186 /DNA_ID=CAMNT_0025714535 /DNA_START=61 /DNA_END=623 /DNA_ORIENTATION=+
MLTTIDDVDSGNEAAAHRRRTQSKCGSVVYKVSDQNEILCGGGAQFKGDPGRSHHLAAADNRLRALVEADVDERAQQGQEQSRNEREAGPRSIQAATSTRRVVVDGFQKLKGKGNSSFFLGGSGGSEPKNDIPTREALATCCVDAAGPTKAEGLKPSARTARTASAAKFEPRTRRAMSLAVQGDGL